MANNQVFGETNYDNIFLNNLSNCKSAYLEEDKLNSFFDFGHGSSVNIMHVNCRSIKKNFKSLKCLLHGLDESITAIGISETWLNSTGDNSFDINGYKFVSNPRLNRPGGGVGIFVNCCYDFHICSNLTLMKDHIESIFIEIKQQSTRHIVIGCIYRPPNTDVSLFNSDLTLILDTLEYKH